MKGPRIVKKKAIDTAKDSYLLGAAPQEEAVCKGCGAVWRGKRWTMEGEAAPPGIKAETVCPACRKTRDRFAEGFVTIQGAFTKSHKDEILKLLHNKGERARRINPLERIMEIKERNGAIEVSTTTDKLAQRIGRMLHKSFNGEVEYKWSSGVKLARVVWTREE
ncbi:MAG: ATPase [Deltaproteobacteria bacterium]|nr:ATPase [Deltaproteobacteria bacterium]